MTTLIIEDDKRIFVYSDERETQLYKLESIKTQYVADSMRIVVEAKDIAGDYTVKMSFPFHMTTIINKNCISNTQ